MHKESVAFTIIYCVLLGTMVIAALSLREIEFARSFGSA
jgi:hypothetical protein